MLTSYALAMALLSQMKAIPEYQGRHVRVCYDSDCTEIDIPAALPYKAYSINPGEGGPWGLDGAPSVFPAPEVDQPQVSSEGSTAAIISGVMGGLVKAGAIKADARVVVDYAHEVKAADGSSESHKVHVEVGGSVETGGKGSGGK